MTARFYAVTFVSILLGSIAGCAGDRVEDVTTGRHDGGTVGKDDAATETIGDSPKKIPGVTAQKPANDDVKKIVYSPSHRANTVRRGVISEIRPFLARVRPEDPKRIAIHFLTPDGPAFDDEPGVWQEDVWWVGTLASLSIKVKTPDGQMFEIRPQPEDVTRLERETEQSAGRYDRRNQRGYHRGYHRGHRRPFWRGPSVFIELQEGVIVAEGVVRAEDVHLMLASPDRLDMSVEGKYAISVHGTVDILNEDVPDIRFNTAETIVEVSTYGLVSTHEIINLARATIDRAETERNDTEYKHYPHLVDDKDGNRVYHYYAGRGHRVWSYSAGTAIFHPDGSIVRTSVRDVGTCIASESLVETEQGSFPIEHLTVGMKLWAFDLERGVKVLTPLRQISSHISPRTLRFPSGMNVTASHPVWTKNSWKQAGDLQPGDVIRRFDGSLEAVGKPEVIERSVSVYDLTVEAPHNFYADGVLVHNKSVRYGPGHGPWYQHWPGSRKKSDSKKVRSRPPATRR